MSRFQYLDRENYGVNKGTYYHWSHWTERNYRVVKDTEAGMWVMTISDRDGRKIATSRAKTLLACDIRIRDEVWPLVQKSRMEQQVREDKARQERAEKAAREKAERLSKDSHLDSDVWIKAKMTKDEAITLASALLYWVSEGRHSEGEGIDLNIRFTDSTREAGWRDEANDARMEVSAGWTSRGEVRPIIEDSFIGKRAKPEPVSDDENLGVAV